MEDNYLMYSVNRSDKLNQEYYVNPAQRTDVSDFSESDFSNSRERQSRERQNRERQSRERQSREGQSRERQSRERQSRERQSRERQSREGQSRERQTRARPKLDSYQGVEIGRALFQRSDVSETDFSESEISNTQERESGSRPRHNSYQEAQVNRGMLQQMQRSYKLNGGMSESNISLDEKPKVKKRTVCWVVMGVLAILLILLVLLLASIALTIFIFWKGFVEVPASSPDQSISPQQLVGYNTQINSLFDEVGYLQEAMNVSTGEINALVAQLNDLIETTNINFATVEAMNALTNQLNQLSAITRNNITSVDTRINDVQTETMALNDHVSRLDGQSTTIQNDVTSVQSQANGLQASITNINNRLENPVNLYQNCRQETRVCNITTFRDTRLFCSTMAILRDIENYYTLDVRCEFGLGFLNTLEAPSLLQQETPQGLMIFCQCSMVHPTADGHMTLADPIQPVTCTLIILRCPLSQTVIQNP